MAGNLGCGYDQRCAASLNKSARHAPHYGAGLIFCDGKASRGMQPCHCVRSIRSHAGHQDADDLLCQLVIERAAPDGSRFVDWELAADTA